MLNNVISVDVDSLTVPIVCRREVETWRVEMIVKATQERLAGS